MKRLLFTGLIMLGLGAAHAQEGYAIGAEVQDFSLKNIDGEMVSLSDFADQEGVIVVFTCNTCPYAVAYEERIIDLANSYNEKGWPVLAIQPNDPGRSPGDSYDKMVARADEKGYGFPYVFDQSQDITRAFGATRTPHVYLLQVSDGKFVVRYIGSIDDNPQDASGVETKYVEEAIEALKAGTAVPRESTKAIGCGIKWAS
ncbi:MAG: thioredoxin family protein [Bacteroidia bacterium]|nr:thioredoxin family protein [Bacteroidia bacterium]